MNKWELVVKKGGIKRIGHGVCGVPLEMGMSG